MAQDGHNSTEHDEQVDHHTSEHHAHSYTALFWPFLAILLGVIIKNYIPSIPVLNRIPFTGFLFLFWLIVQVLHEQNQEVFSHMGNSMDMWIEIDPHLLLFAFLPALLFGDAKSIDTHLLSRKLKEILILASFGVLIGTALTAQVTKWIIPSFSWNLAMVMGSILAATDPVAVVSLLKELGAPPALTMVISGESMFNDGTAIVVFNLFLSLYTKENGIVGGVEDYAYETPGEIIFYAFRAVAGGCLFGLMGGVISFVLLHAFDNRLHEENALLQLTTTLSMAYLVFYVAEGMYGTSGVIATVTYGMFFSEYSRGLIVNYEVLEAGWECFEFMGNTLIFSLAGCIVGHIMMDSHTLKFVKREDLAMIVLSWVGSFVTRIIMLVCVYPLMKFVRRNEWKNPSQPHSDAKDILVEAWGGLRGAVGLALAILVRNQNIGASHTEEGNGIQLLVHVCGVAGLTLLVNATTATPLLKTLGMTEASQTHKAAVEVIHMKVVREVMAFGKQLIDGHNDGDFNSIVRNAINKREVSELCSVINENQSVDVLNRGASESIFTPPDRGVSSLYSNSTISSESDTWEKRELLIKFVRAEYNEMIDHRSIILPPERHQASRILLNSTLHAMDNLSKIGDWEYVRHFIDKKNRVTLALLQFLDYVGGTFKGRAKNTLRLRFVYSQRLTAYSMLLAFERGHTEAQKKLIEMFSVEDPDTVEVVEESKKLCIEARKLRHHMDSELKRRVTVEHLAARILHFERNKVVKLVDGGVLTGNDEHHLLRQNEKDLARLKKRDHSLAQELARDATFRRNMPGGSFSRADEESTIYAAPSKIHPTTEQLGSVREEAPEGGKEGGDEELQETGAYESRKFKEEIIKGSELKN